MIMKFCYAHRRFSVYPDSLNSWNLEPASYTDAFLARVAAMGFAGLEVGVEVFDKLSGEEKRVKDLGKRFVDAGTPVLCIRSGGTLTEAKHGPANREKQLRAIQYAGWVGATVINGALSAPFRYPGKPGSSTGWPVAQDSSREARFSDYEGLARVYQRACDVAADHGVTLSVEVHQNSLVDNSWSALLLHQMVNRSNFGINPDLGNIFWCYDVPEEDTETAIKALAPVAAYWHCKNLLRVHHPENERAVFLRVPLSDGEIDYRFAITAMAKARYQGYMAIEGIPHGDQFYADARSLEYAQTLWAEVTP
jgi:sugar phosphate isomerase/epimerase